ncbi:Voltage-dependent L-type calcium channel subunit alpha-1S [Symbiodinium microadriaticum]|uniref:Voltage-dependent L-type calcium channel subunit alpha-1S n=1 Tax=Symbiodinium microadriaticum TaxID=2951 RepID=A0A1Q9DYC4_SYMMI|nr:Voltage-dependent L-type calcium channel subunit alpha-1S [Symbiodinium microadriaticum]
MHRYRQDVIWTLATYQAIAKVPVKQSPVLSSSRGLPPVQGVLLHKTTFIPQSLATLMADMGNRQDEDGGTLVPPGQDEWDNEYASAVSSALEDVLANIQSLRKDQAAQSLSMERLAKQVAGLRVTAVEPKQGDLPEVREEDSAEAAGIEFKEPSEDSGTHARKMSRSATRVIRDEFREFLKVCEMLQRPAKVAPLLPRSEEEEEIPWYRHIGRTVIENRFFEKSVGLVIVINSVMLGIETERSIQNMPPGWPEDVEYLFMTFYTIELVLRLMAYGWARCCTDGWFLFDAVLVFVAYLGKILPLLMSAFGSDGQEGMMEQIMVVRMLRILRFVRALRVVKQFGTIWKLIRGLLTSFDVMASAVVLVFLMLYIFACLGMELIGGDPELKTIPVKLAFLFAALGRNEALSDPEARRTSTRRAYLDLQAALKPRVPVFGAKLARDATVRHPAFLHRGAGDHIRLLSGKTISLDAELDESVEALTRRARKSLAVQVCGTYHAFAAILGNGSVVTWGAADYGSVVTWGDKRFGGDSCAVQHRLQNVQHIQATNHAFAAVLYDKSVVTWGYDSSGGDSRAVQSELTNVHQIQSNKLAFAAVLDDGSVVAWGDAESGGDTSTVKDQLHGVQRIQSSARAFAAILTDGSVVPWGDALAGGCGKAVQDRLQNVQQIQATERAFAAIADDGSVVTWGDADFGGDSDAVQDQLKNVQQIQANIYAFAAILGDGSVVTWGNKGCGGDSSAVQGQLINVIEIQATTHAFAALLADGSVVTWGSDGYAGDSSDVQGQLKNVKAIQASGYGFAALLRDGSVVTWGEEILTGDSTDLEDRLQDVQQIQAAKQAFAAITGDGCVVAWGSDSCDDCSAVQHLLWDL